MTEQKANEATAGAFEERLALFREKLQWVRDYL
jgi:hypothetical protein